jgi:hypothetical protein
MFYCLMELTSRMILSESAVWMPFLALQDVHLSHAELGADSQCRLIIIGGMPPKGRNKHHVTRSLNKFNGPIFDGKPQYNFRELRGRTQGHSIIGCGWRTSWWI